MIRDIVPIPGSGSSADTLTEVALGTAEYSRVFAVLDAVSPASSNEQFRESLIEAVADIFGVRYVTFFLGDDLPEAFHDNGAISTGGPRAERGLREYHERWGKWDPFATSAALTCLSTHGVVSLDWLSGLPVTSCQYITDYLHWEGHKSCGAMALTMPKGQVGVVGIFDSNHYCLQPATLSALGLLSRHLGVVARGLSIAAPTWKPLPEITSRQSQIADLVSLGLSNAEIGRRMYLTENAVKKHISRILAATGCANRTQLTARIANERILRQFSNDPVSLPRPNHA